MCWRTRDSLGHVSQWGDSWQNQGVSQISPLFLDLNGRVLDIRSTEDHLNSNDSSRTYSLFIFGLQNHDD